MSWLFPKNKKKERKETQRCDKSHICSDHPRCATRTKVVMWGGVPDIVNHAEFHQNRFWGFRSPRGRNLPFSYLYWLSGSGSTDVTALWCKVWSMECSDNHLSVSDGSCAIHCIYASTATTAVWTFSTAAAQVLITDDDKSYYVPHDTWIYYSCVLDY